MNTPTEETTALILSGQGYEIEIAPEALARRAGLIIAAGAIQHVRDNDESGDAAHHVRNLAALRIEVEKARKLVKEPVLAVGKKIDQAAKDFLADVESEEIRIKKLIGDHATEVARLKAEKEEEERIAFEAARAAREAAESGGIAAVLASKQALAGRLAASSEVAATKIADGVRFAWDFEVVDIHLLARAHPHLVRIEPKRAEILADIKAAAEDGASMDAYFWQGLGIRPFQKPVVSSR